ncbi:MAG: iron-sulfur cluster assembly scaffold protein [Pseudomonadota bacterium]
MTHQSEARSRTCGSSIRLGLNVGSDGAVTQIGMQVTACAIGQSSAAIMAAHASGAKAADILAMEAEVKAWLRDEGHMPEWPGFEALEPAREHAARHGALLLVWTAARQALSSARATG